MRNCSYESASLQLIVDMVQKKYVIITGACLVIIVIGLAVGVAQIRRNDAIRPVANHVPTLDDTKSTAVKSQASSTMSITQSSPANSTQPATGTQNSPSASNTGSSAAVAQMPDPSTFSQYDSTKYKDASESFYADLQAGTGTMLTAGHKAAVYYKGWLTNGQLFDETRSTTGGQPQPFIFTFDSNPEQVIPGWDEGLVGMKVGGVRMLIVPPAAGYGASGQGPIPGNAVLIFEVQLVAVQ